MQPTESCLAGEFGLDHGRLQKTARSQEEFRQTNGPIEIYAGVLCSQVPLRAALKPPFPQLNLHSTRVRRNPSGFLQVAVSNARQSTVLSTSSFCRCAHPIQR